MQLTPSQLDTWEVTGRLWLSQALEPQKLAELNLAVGEVESWSQGTGPGMHHFEMTDGGPRIARSEDFDPHHPGLSTFLRRGLIAEVLDQLFDEPAMLFKEKINYKHPGGAGFAPHQDATAYRNAELASIERHISVMVPLDPSTEASGCLFFTDGSANTEARNTILANTAGCIDPSWVENATWVPVETGPGDLVFFDSFAPHYSGTNNSDRSRRAMYLTYNRASDGDQRQRYYTDKAAVFAAAENGDRAKISVNDDFLGRPVDEP